MGHESKRSIIVIPTYNEALNIAELIKELNRYVPDACLFVVDGHSPDGTAEVVKDLQRHYPHLKLQENTCRRGLAAAYRQGFAYACNEAFDAIVQMDADFSHDPECVPRLLEKLQQYEIVVGSRYCQEQKKNELSFMRKKISCWANKLASRMLQLPIRDLTSGFKAYRRTALMKTNFLQMHSRGYACQFEMLFHAYLNGCTIGEVPISFMRRQKGKSKFSCGIIVEALFRLCQLTNVKRKNQPKH